MNLEYIVKPIAQWPGKRRHGSEQKRSPFSRQVQSSFNSEYSYTRRESGAPWSRILSSLARELKNLRASGVVLRLDVQPHQLRNDGGIKSNASPASSAVMLEFVAEKFRPAPKLLYKCDVFRDWQSNVYAIAKSLEALRLVDRYEVTTAGEQYAGFKALPSTTSATLTTQAAAEIIYGFAPNYTPQAIASVSSAARDAVRLAIHKTHPDRNNGGRADYDKVDAARRVLSSVHGISL